MPSRPQGEGSRQRRGLSGLPGQTVFTQTRRAKHNGFSPHAAEPCAADDRQVSGNDSSGWLGPTSPPGGHPSLASGVA